MTNPLSRSTKPALFLCFLFIFGCGNKLDEATQELLSDPAIQNVVHLRIEPGHHSPEELKKNFEGMDGIIRVERIKGASSKDSYLLGVSKNGRSGSAIISHLRKEHHSMNGTVRANTPDLKTPVEEKDILPSENTNSGTNDIIEIPDIFDIFTRIY